jgi:hypothetical protein
MSFPELRLHRSALRSALAVVLGIATLTVLSFAIEMLADALLPRVFPNALPDQASLARSPGARVLMSLYGAACIALGGYVTAWVARRAPAWHALAMGLIQAALTLYAMHALAGHAPASATPPSAPPGACCAAHGFAMGRPSVQALLKLRSIPRAIEPRSQS